MREIQDLTLQTERGLQAIDRLFEQRRRAFHQWAKRGVAEPDPYALRVTLVPTAELYIDQVYQNPKLFPRVRNCTLFSRSDPIPLHLPSPVEERPILRGAQRMTDVGTVIVVQEMHCNGLGEIRFSFEHPEDKNIPIDPSLILAAAANGLLMADAFRIGVGAPDVEYAFQMEFMRIGYELRLAPFYHRLYSDILGIITPNPCLFPRLSVGGLEEFGRIMKLVTNDLCNAAGARSIEEEFSLKVQ